MRQSHAERDLEGLGGMMRLSGTRRLEALKIASD
jgi:hypothetical protein